MKNDCGKIKTKCSQPLIFFVSSNAVPCSLEKSRHFTVEEDWNEITLKLPLILYNTYIIYRSIHEVSFNEARVFVIDIERQKQIA